MEAFIEAHRTDGLTGVKTTEYPTRDRTLNICPRDPVRYHMYTRTLSLLTALALVAPAASAHAFDHSPYQSLLTSHVKHGRVSYAGIRGDRAARTRLNGYVASLGRASIAKLGREAQLAFFLNAYNALVIKAVVDRMPLSSVMKVKGFFKRFKHRVAGRDVTLDQLENSIIRPRFKEPRIHFALVCAAKSCPPLSSRAFSARSLERHLDGLARAFINGPHGVQVKGGKATISKLFQWYEGDFKAAAGSLGKYLARYDKKNAALLVKGGFSYLHYNWELNQR